MKFVKCLAVMLILLSITSCSLNARTTEVNVNLAANNSSNPENTTTNIPVEEAQNEQSNLATENTDAPAVTPEAVIKEVYAIHARDNDREDRIISSKNRKYLDKYFDKNLADLIWKDLTTHTDEVGVIDFDLFYAAQDMEIKNLVVGKSKITGDKATVPVSFTNFGKKENLNYSLTKEKGAWKISDIKYSNNDSLLGYFKENEKSEAAFKNFEGSFQVGSTTCTVKAAVDSAYELSWAKGAGTMKFYFQGSDNGKYVFASEDNGKAQDKFMFDDETLKSGKFVRADGTQMPVKKLK